MVSATQLGFFYSQWRDLDTLKIHPPLWKISNIGDSAFAATFLSGDLEVSTKLFKYLKNLSLMKGIPHKFTMGSCYSSFEKNI